MRACIKIIQNNCDPCGVLKNPTLHSLPERGNIAIRWERCGEGRGEGMVEMGKQAKNAIQKPK